MKLLALALVLGSALLAPLQESEPDDARPTAFTEKTWKGCAACHATPDRRVPHDARWIELNRKTACLTDEAATEVNRARLIAMLEEQTMPLPPLYRGEGERDETAGFLQVPTTVGSAFLRPRGEPGSVRVVWDACEDGSRVAVPEGRYDLIGYSFYRKDDEGRWWSAAATIQEGTVADVVEVVAGEEVVLPIAMRIYHDLEVTADGTKLDVKFQMRNEAGDRMTLAHSGSLVEPSWFVFGEPGEGDRASGPLTPT
ncbi:MAG: hypothetical protein AAF726_11295 [Planctomycetota bacterium]